MNEVIASLPRVRGDYRLKAALKNWFNVGGPAEILFRPADFDDLQFFLKNLKSDIALNIIGAGSNLIIDDAGVAGVVIKMGSNFAQISHIVASNQSDSEFLQKLNLNEHYLISAGAATLCTNLASYCQHNGIGGLEFLSTIPGSVGGAIAMNAGCYGKEIANCLEGATALDFQGNVSVLSNANLGFSYRCNKSAKNFLFVSGVFQGFASSPELVAAKIAEFKESRRASQPICAKTGGSTFKNPTNDFLATGQEGTARELKAWQLIDAIGFRGKSMGDAQFSEKHCNFLINNGKAKAADLLALGEEARKKVKEKFGIDLEWEIKHLK